VVVVVVVVVVVSGSGGGSGSGSGSVSGRRVNPPSSLFCQLFPIPTLSGVSDCHRAGSPLCSQDRLIYPQAHTRWELISPPHTHIYAHTHTHLHTSISMYLSIYIYIYISQTCCEPVASSVVPHPRHRGLLGLTRAGPRVAL